MFVRLTMDKTEEYSFLDALDVEGSSMGASCSRERIPLDTKSCRRSKSSDRIHNRMRWTPYSKKRKLLPKKSFSLETLPARSHIERAHSFELTQSTDDHLSIRSEPSIDLDCGVADTTLTTSRLLSTMDDEFRQSDKNCNAAESRISSFEKFKPDQTGESDVETINHPVLLESTAEPPETSKHQDGCSVTKPDQPPAEWALWCAYAKFMKFAWRKSRANLNEQTHRAENCELQAKFTIMQVHSLKNKISTDISELRKRVSRIQSAKDILESTTQDKTRLLSENGCLKAKIECLLEEKNRLSEKIFLADIEESNEVESFKAQLAVCEEELTDLQAEKVVLDSEIQELMSLSEQAKENVATRRNNLYNRKLEIGDIQRELAATKEKISLESRMLKTVQEQAQVLNKEIRIATEDGEELEKQLEEAREKVIARDSLVAEFSAKVASAVEEISSLKDGPKSGGKKSFWRRFKFLPKDGHSLFSIQL